MKKVKNIEVVETKIVKPKKRKEKKGRRAYNQAYKPRKSSLTSCELIEGEPLEHKVRRMLKNNEPITDGAPDIYTERKDGVGAGYDVRTDRWELAADAMDKVAASKLSARDNKGKVIPLKQENEEGGEAKNTDGGTN
jgi:hypothetical protein